MPVTTERLKHNCRVLCKEAVQAYREALSKEDARSSAGFIGVGPKSASNIWTCTIMYLAVIGAVEQVVHDVYNVM